MKPTRGPASAWLHSIPRERRTALISLALLLSMLASLMIYQRLSSDGSSPSPGTEHDSPTQPVTGTDGNTGLSGEPAFEPDPSATPFTLELVRPLTGDRPVLRPFGFGYAEAFADYRVHPGIDYAAEHGEAVVAAAGGILTAIEDDPYEGRVVTIDHGHGMISRYAGLGELLLPINARVDAGMAIGYIGDPGSLRTGHGPHLHFQLLIDGDPVDPASYIAN